MTWFRTRSGRLIHGVGGLAAAYADRGWAVVDDATAEAEVASGEAQTRVDVESELAATVDAIVARADEAKALREKQKQQDPPGELHVTHGTPPLTVGEEAAVAKVMDEEGPR